MISPTSGSKKISSSHSTLCSSGLPEVTISIAAMMNRIR